MHRYMLKPRGRQLSPWRSGWAGVAGRGGGMMVMSQMAIKSLGFFWVVTSICCRACAGDRTVEAGLAVCRG